MTLVAVDRLDVLVLVDNVTDGLSTTPAYVVPEWAGLLAAGRLPTIAGESICCAHHGLSLLITAHAGGRTRTVLFDAGPEGAILERNAAVLGVDFGAIDAVVLSHGHWDHGGGLLAAVGSVARRRAQPVDCYVHPGMFAQRAMTRPNGELFVHAPLPDPEALTRAGARVVSTRQAQAVADGAFYVSGEIPRVTAYEAGLPGHVRRRADGQGWEPDPLIMDERFLSVHVKGKGQVVFSACSHAGIVNVLTHARGLVPPVPLHGVMGGFHLSGATEKIIPDTVADLKTFGLKMLAPGHCTGWRALSVMAREFGDELVPSAVGKRYTI
ncbi:MAG TPA: MBL fold metallo-hydrolase [Candidatus Limnocylindria bacterium]|nr:MBL fold metallo-hydrolase [Candidatus Limnocylindria bacterium]